ncbi:MAG: phosphotransferase [Candidatus Heimdallarchaeaceae archaeon]
MNSLPILDEVAKKLKVSVDDIKFRKDLVGTSTAKVSEISWGKSKNGILKQNTTKTEWVVYSKIATKHKIPAPKVLAISQSSDVPWILLEKIPKSIHPKDWKEENIVSALKELAKLHSKFYNKTDIKELSELPRKDGSEWKSVKANLQTNIQKALKIAENYKDKTPLTKTDLETVKKDLNSKVFLENLLSAGQTMIHGGTWTYNFLQTNSKIYLLDWQECVIAPPACDFIHFYDLLPFQVEGFRVKLNEIPFTFKELQKIYLDELKKNKVTIKIADFKKSLRAAVSLQIAHHWCPMLKPDVIYLRGGRYYISRTLRLWPSRKAVRQHFTDLMGIRKLK